MTLKTVFLLLLCAGVGLSAPMACMDVNGSPLSTFLAPGFSCDLGGAVFSGFDRVLNSGNAPKPDASLILVHFPGSGIGISFDIDLTGLEDISHAGWYAPGPGENENSLVDIISFVLTMPGHVFSSVTLDVVGRGHARSSHNHVDETINGEPVLVVGDFPLDFGEDPLTRTAQLGPGQSTLNIIKQIHLGEGDGEWGQILSVSQGFGYQEGIFSVPEPATFGLIGLALASLGFLRKRLR